MNRPPTLGNVMLVTIGLLLLIPLPPVGAVMIIIAIFRFAAWKGKVDDSKQAFGASEAEKQKRADILAWKSLP